MVEYIIQVDENDREIGSVEKMDAHRKGLLHRAFSILIFNSNNQLLLQKRHSAKYHSGGLWTNTCCSHPRQGEEIEAAAHRRLQEEMGFDCELKEIFSFIYRAELDNNLIENEYDHVFLGRFDGEVVPHEEEAEDFRWVDMDEIERDIANNPEVYSYWFKCLFDRIPR
jgi:isopentenyl-diphosphate Delta-isomerase